MTLDSGARSRLQRRTSIASRSPSYSPRLRSRSPSRSRSRSPSTGGRDSPSRDAAPGRRRDSRSPSLRLSRNRDRIQDSRSPASRDRGGERQTGNGRNTRRTVAVEGLTKMVYESHLEKIFCVYGIVEDIVLLRNRRSGESRGKAYIVYRSSSSVQKAEEQMDGGQIDGCIVTVCREDIQRHEYDARDGQRYDRRGHEDRNANRRYG